MGLPKCHLQNDQHTDDDDDDDDDEIAPDVSLVPPVKCLESDNSGAPSDAWHHVFALGSLEECDVVTSCLFFVFAPQLKQRHDHLFYNCMSVRH